MMSGESAVNQMMVLMSRYKCCVGLLGRTQLIPKHSTALRHRPPPGIPLMARHSMPRMIAPKSDGTVWACPNEIDMGAIERRRAISRIVCRDQYMYNLTTIISQKLVVARQVYSLYAQIPAMGGRDW